MVYQFQWQSAADLKDVRFVELSPDLKSLEDWSAWCRHLTAEYSDKCPDGCLPLVCTMDSEYATPACNWEHPPVTEE